MEKRLPKIDQVILNQQRHEILDAGRFAKIPTRDEVISIVGNTVDIKINGKLVDLKNDNIVLKRNNEDMNHNIIIIQEHLERLLPAERATTWIRTLGKIISWVLVTSIGLTGLIKLILWKI